MPTERKRKEVRTTDVNGRMLPHSAEAEQSVLSCAMIDDVAAVYMLEHLDAKMFYSEANALIFDAMNAIKTNRANIDFVTLIDALERSGRLERVGGATYITQLSRLEPNAVNHRTYVDIVRNKYILRSIVAACSSAIASAYDNEDAAEVLNETEKSIYDVAKIQSDGQLVPVSGVLPDVIKLMEDLKDPRNFRGIPTGFVALNHVLNGLHRGELVLLAARPSIGKTALGMNLVANAALAEGESVGGKRRRYVCAVFSLEMTKEQLVLRLISQIGRVPLEHINNGKATPDEWRRIRTARELLAGCRLYIDDTSLQRPIQIMEKCIRLRNQAGGLDLVMIDYLGLLASNRERRDDSRQNEVAEITRYLKVMAKDLNVPVLLLSQLSRKVEQRQGMRPILSDLRESGAIEQDADVVLFIHRAKQQDDEPAQIVVAKHRNGRLADIDVEWHGAYVRFEDKKDDPAVQREAALGTPPPRADEAQPDAAYRADEDEAVFGAEDGEDGTVAVDPAELERDAQAHAMPADEQPIAPAVDDSGDGFADPDEPVPDAPPDDDEADDDADETDDGLDGIF